LGDNAQASQPDFDDTAWKNVKLPHDWSIEGEIKKDNPSGSQGGFYPGGIGYYRKTFQLQKEWKDKLVLIKPVTQALTLDEMAYLIGEDCDIILTDGFKQDNAPKIEVHRREVGPPLSAVKKLIVTFHGILMNACFFNPVGISYHVKAEKFIKTCPNCGGTNFEWVGGGARAIFDFIGSTSLSGLLHCKKCGKDVLPIELDSEKSYKEFVKRLVRKKKR